MVPWLTWHWADFTLEDLMAWLSIPSPLFPLSTHTHWFLIQGSVTRPSQVTPVIKGGSPMWKVHTCSKLPWLFALTNFRPQENCCGKIVREWNVLLEPITMNGIYYIFDLFILIYAYILYILILAHKPLRSRGAVQGIVYCLGKSNR